MPGRIRHFGGMFILGVVLGLLGVTLLPATVSQASSPGPAPPPVGVEATVAAADAIDHVERDPVRSPRDRREPSSRTVTLAFGGDVMFEGAIGDGLNAEPWALLAGVQPLLVDADLAMVNLETAITQRGVPEPKEFTFRAPATALEALTAGGVDVVSLANNHGMDYGRDGLEDTLLAAEAAGLPLVGAGRNDEAAYAPFVTSVRGHRIAVLGATQVMDTALLSSWPALPDRPGLASGKPDHERKLLEAVAAARREADTVVVYLHWGVEREICPTWTQQDLAQRLADAGADVIVGGHAHRLQGAGMLDDSVVAYGLGNFVFATSSAAGTESGVLLVTIAPDDGIGYEWKPARISGGLPQVLGPDEAVPALAAWEALRTCTGLADEGTGG